MATEVASLDKWVVRRGHTAAAGGDSPDGTMNRQTGAIARSLTVKYVLTLGLLAGLALANYLILWSQIAAGRSVADVVLLAGRQRALFQRSALLAQELASTKSPARREELRRALSAAVKPMEQIHYGLIRKDSAVPPPESVREIYDDSP